MSESISISSFALSAMPKPSAASKIPAVIISALFLLSGFSSLHAFAAEKSAGRLVDVAESRSADGRKLVTNLDKCAPWKSEPESDESRRRCGKIGSWDLTWKDSDDRQSLVLDRAGGKTIRLPFPKFLNYPEPFQAYACTIDPKVEWRMHPKTREPLAAMARLTWSTDANDPEPRREHEEIMVARIEGSKPGCIVSVIDAKAKSDAEERSREMMMGDIGAAECLSPKDAAK